MHKRSDPQATERILRSLPAWFGIEDAIVDYAAKSTVLESYVSEDEHGDVVGVALFERHFPQSAELSLIAVHADHRGGGHGRKLVEAGEEALRRDGCQYLEVHTVGASFEDPGYAATRSFYLSLGFAPMHEFDGLDWDGPTLILIKRL
ncbi:GNAT family N-acetyltransferase [Microbacterium sp.]|uniref:GNAT family N-acetyltransferase n=1 Tax=Microbacterium sp. TaxID=51671 RepID=UPI003F727479